MKIRQLKNIRKKSLFTIYALLKNKTRKITRLGNEFYHLTFSDNNDKLELLCIQKNLTTNKLHNCEEVLNSKKIVRRIKIRVSRVKYTHITKYMNRRSKKIYYPFKPAYNRYKLIGLT